MGFYQIFFFVVVLNANKKGFLQPFNYKAVKLYAISHKINYREKRSSPWPLVPYKGENNENILFVPWVQSRWDPLRTFRVPNLVPNPGTF